MRKKVFVKWGGTGVQEVLNTAFYGLLNMIVAYPVEDPEKLTNSQGQVLPDCFLVTKGTTAKQFAYRTRTSYRSCRRNQGDKKKSR